MSKFYQSSILLLSEAIWIYYLIALFMLVEWNNVVFIPVLWWIIAGISGYIINLLIARKFNYIYVLMTNGFILIALIVLNWNSAVPKGAWVLGICLSIAVSYLFIRSASFVYNKTTRMQMLQKFEFNIFIYLIFLVLFSFNGWVYETFHILFLSVIFASLLGLLFTLEQKEQSLNKHEIDIYKVGNISKFIVVVSGLFLIIIGMSSLLFFPIVRNKLQDAGFAAWHGLLWVLQLIGDFFIWILSFFDSPEHEGEVPGMMQDEAFIMDDIGEEIAFSLPLPWIFGSIGIIVMIIIFLLIARYLKLWQPPSKNQVSPPFKTSSFALFIEACKRLIAWLRIKLRSSFQRFYIHNVYWYFFRLQQWGKKKGLPRQNSETSQQYIDKIIDAIQDRETTLTQSEKKQLINELHQLNRDYYAIYYGRKEIRNTDTYKQLLRKIKAIQIKSL